MEAKVGAGLTAGVVAEYGKFAWPGRDWREFDSGPGSRLSSAVSVLLHQNGANPRSHDLGQARVRELPTTYFILRRCFVYLVNTVGEQSNEV